MYKGADITLFVGQTLHCFLLMRTYNLFKPSSHCPGYGPGISR